MERGDMKILKVRAFSFRHRQFGFRIICILTLGYMIVWSMFVMVWANPNITRHDSETSRDSLCHSLNCRKSSDQSAVKQGNHEEMRKRSVNAMSLSHNQTKREKVDSKSKNQKKKTLKIDKTERRKDDTKHKNSGAANRNISHHDSSKKNPDQMTNIKFEINLKSVKERIDEHSFIKSNPKQKDIKPIKKTLDTATDEFNHNATRDYFKLQGSGLNSLINLHRYVFSMLPDACSERKGINIVIMVHTSINHFRKRQTLRDSLRAKTMEQGFSIGIVFLIGQTDNMDYRVKLENESRLNKDLVQGNFKDTYHNLLYKHIMGYHWVIHYCKDSEYVIKMDDDVIINIENVVNYITEKQVPDGNIACSAYRKSKIKKQGKWSKLRNQFPFSRFPPYCSGFAYLVPMSVVERLYNASSGIRYFWIDDVYVTGLLTLTTATRLQGLSKSEAYKHTVKSPIPEEIRKSALFIFIDPGYKMQK